jgi:hypothetical protein
MIECRFVRFVKYERQTLCKFCKSACLDRIMKQLHNICRACSHTIYITTFNPYKCSVRPNTQHIGRSYSIPSIIRAAFAMNCTSLQYYCRYQYTHCDRCKHNITIYDDKIATKITTSTSYVHFDQSESRIC